MKPVNFNRAITTIPADELKRVYASVLDWDESGACTEGIAFVTRSIIANELEFPSEDGARDLRDIWYSSVKPVFSKLGMLRKPLGGKQSDKEFTKMRTDALQKAVRKMVADGEITYRQLGVIDHSRSKQGAVRYVSHGKMPDYSVSFGQYPHLVLATEKDTQYAELVRIAALYGCSAISGTGQSSCAAIEGLLEAITEDNYFTMHLRSASDKIIFLPFTDYDGHGFDIANTFETQMKDCVRNAKVRKHGISNALIDVETVRLGINLDQLPEEQVRANMYELPKNKVNRDWFKETDGVYGEFMGLELNAMRNAQRAKIITDALGKIIEPASYASGIRRAYVRKIAMESLASSISDAADEVVSRFTGEGYKSQYKPCPAPDISIDSIQSLALAGNSAFPIEIEGAPDDDIRAEMLSRVLDALDPE